MGENFPTLSKDINQQIQESEQITNRIDTEKSMHKHIVQNYQKQRKNSEKNNASLFIGVK